MNHIILFWVVLFGAVSWGPSHADSAQGEKPALHFHEAQTIPEKRLNAILSEAKMRGGLVSGLLGRSEASHEQKALAESFFSQNLRAGWRKKEQEVVQATCGGVYKDGELCGLDYDPLLCAQDDNDGSFVFITEKMDKRSATIFMRWDDNAEGPPIATYTMLWAGGSWKIERVHCRAR